MKTWLVLCGALALGAEAQAAKSAQVFESAAPADHSLAQQVLNLAIQGQFQGNYQADMELIRASYQSGMEKLNGSIQVDDGVGQRIIALKGRDEGFVYRSENFGAEQWVQEQKSQRMRRIANRQWKKNALGSVLSYEDLMRLPGDILKSGDSFKDFRQDDSTYFLSVGLKSQGMTFYSRADAVVSKMPIRLRSLVLYDAQGKRCKQVEMVGYTEVQGKWFLNRFHVTNCDSSASTWVTLRNPTMPDMGSLAKADHVLAPSRPPALRTELPLPSAQPSAPLPIVLPDKVQPVLAAPGQVRAGEGVHPQAAEPGPVIEAEPTVDD